MRRLMLLGTSLCVVGCGAPPPDRVNVSLAPDVVSSESGALTAEAVVLNGNTELKGWTVKLHVDYTDRNGTAHDVADASDKSDNIGLYRGTFEGLKWGGAGTVTASVLDPAGQPALDAKKMPITGSAAFSVTDESPPTVMITSPAANAQITRGARLTVTVAATDEIGVSQIYVQVVTMNGNNIDRTRSTILASGTTNGTASFDFDTGNVQTTTTAIIYAMAADMSGNLAVSPSVPITIN